MSAEPTLSPPYERSRKRPRYGSSEAESRSQTPKDTLPGVQNLILPPFFDPRRSQMPHLAYSTSTSDRNFPPHLHESSRRGFDFRYPIMSTNAAAEEGEPSETDTRHDDRAQSRRSRNGINPTPVIDLTEEPDSPPRPPSSRASRHRRRTPHRSTRPPRRPPHFDRDILIEFVDLGNEEQAGSSRVAEDDAESEGSDVEFVSSRRRTPPPAPPVNERAIQPRRDAAQGTAGLLPGVMRMVNQASWASNSWGLDLSQQRPPAGPARGFIRAAAASALRPLGLFSGRFDEPDVLLGTPRVPDNGGDMPGPMDYEAQGFQLTNVVQRPQPSAYKAPDPPPAGFTRMAKEEDIVVCPNCGDELGVGDKPVKRQVWVAKPCGHVYCGECATNRAASKQKKSGSPSKTKTFSKSICKFFKEQLLGGWDLVQRGKDAFDKWFQTFSWMRVLFLMSSRLG